MTSDIYGFNWQQIQGWNNNFNSFGAAAIFFLCKFAALFVELMYGFIEL